MEQFKNLEELFKRVDEWFDDLMINKFHFKGDITKEKDIKKFLKTKKISITAERDINNQEKYTYIITYKYKPKYKLVVDEKEMTFEDFNL